MIYVVVITYYLKGRSGPCERSEILRQGLWLGIEELLEKLGQGLSCGEHILLNWKVSVV